MERRHFLLAGGIMLPALGIVGRARAADGDNTPMQFMPKTPPDPDPLDDELAKYPNCPHCGMDRRKWHHSRHLVHYDDGRAVGTCSLRCAAVNLAVNLDRGPRAVYAADFGADAEVKPLIEVGKAVYLVGSTLPGTMTARSKMAFAGRAAAEAARAARGGEILDFEAALREAYLGMAADTAMIRKRRAERRAKAQRAQGR